MNEPRCGFFTDPIGCGWSEREWAAFAVCVLALIAWELWKARRRRQPK
jgi:hypothetical protein